MNDMTILFAQHIVRELIVISFIDACQDFKKSMMCVPSREYNETIIQTTLFAGAAMQSHLMS